MSDEVSNAGAARFTRIFAVVFFLAGVLVFARTIHDSYQRIAAEQALAARSALLTVTPGACLNTEATVQRRSNGSARTYREARATYSYTYAVDGVAYTGRGTLEDTCDQPVGPMQISYLVAEPGQSELVALRDRRMRDAYLSPLSWLFILFIAAWAVRLMSREAGSRQEAEPAPPPEGGDAW